MQETTALFSVAALAITLLGFSTVVSLFTRRQSSWRADGRFWAMLSCGVTSFWLCLIPLGLLAFQYNTSAVWFWSSLSQWLATSMILAFSIYTYRKNLEANKPANFKIFLVFVSLLVLVMVLGLMNLSSTFRQFAPFFVGQLVLLVATSWLYVRLLFVWLH
ncbi:hypothetical protein [Aliagarivorans marinus]|uniref:hypothetical protein n=1 Tax=Aliagarivorans marinus TaxID=561965 RepID=UPI00047C6766|nr:hypothetical protein [Aliagarivorans marinus]